MRRGDHDGWDARRRANKVRFISGAQRGNSRSNIQRVDCRRSRLYLPSCGAPGVEEIVSKRVGSLHRSGRCLGWHERCAKGMSGTDGVGSQPILIFSMTRAGSC
jgi:hypothetical protein